MGDKPTPEPNVHSCGNDNWVDGKQPDSITAIVTGGQNGDIWEPPVPSFPNGSYVMAFGTCGNWQSTGGSFIATLSVTGNSWAFNVFAFVFGTAFSCTGQIASHATGSNSKNDPTKLWYGGSFSADLKLAGGGLPTSWDGAGLVGVPQNQDYFAEELAAETAPRQTRYASHGTKSILHMKGDY